MSDAVDTLLVGAAREAGVVKARVLNVPAGDGMLSKRLDEAGHSAVSADLFPDGCANHDGCAFADMNEPLPFEDAAFDVVMSQEGVEHLENVPLFFRECARVLKPGGHLWITTPNVMDLSSRLAWFLSGQKSFHGALPNEESTLWGTDGTRWYHGHAFTLPYFQMRYLLRLAQFDDIELSGFGKSLGSCLLYPGGRLMTRLLLWRSFRRRQRRDRRRGNRSISDDLVKALKRDARSTALLCHRTVVIHARHRPGSFAVESSGP